MRPRDDTDEGDRLERTRARVDDPTADGAAGSRGDRTWTIESIGDDPATRRVRESVFTTASGRVGTRGTPPAPGTGHEPLVVVAGVFVTDPGDIPRLMPAPLWFLVDGDEAAVPGAGAQCSLDLRRGLLRIGSPTGRDRVTTRFASIARPRVVAQRTVVRAPPGRSASVLEVQRPDLVVGRGSRGDVEWVALGSPVDGEGGIVVAASTDAHRTTAGWALDRTAVVAGDPRSVPDLEGVLAEHAQARAEGFDRLVAEHVGRWADRWGTADVEIEGDERLTRAVRFGLSTLLSSVAEDGEVAVGARGLSGPAYAGHVLWDADVYVLPFLAATMPAGARAMLEYRAARLGPARARARDEGRQGARFPWESATDGSETTPTSVELPGGEVWPVLTGQQEEHVTADIAWATWQYVRWAGDDEFLRGGGGDLVLETARYWASRVEIDADGSGHVRGIIGPDEYHESVDDDCYTNVLARWCLRRAAALVRARGDPGREADRWLTVADALVDGYRPELGRHEQFTGYDGLEPLRATDVARPPYAADVLLGRERTAGSQLLKQPDVLMAHHLVPHEMTAGSLTADLDHYLPRTTHGSSLSPAVHAAVLARADRPEEAYPLLRLAALLDIDDRTGTTAGGLHVATMGSVWQALAVGFLGLRPRVDGLVVDPRSLPVAWRSLTVAVSFRGTPVHVRAEQRRVTVDTSDDVPLLLRGRAAPHHGPVRLVRSGDGGWIPEE